MVARAIPDRGDDPLLNVRFSGYDHFESPATNWFPIGWSSDTS
jgi:hypothetical protein